MNGSGHVSPSQRYRQQAQASKQQPPAAAAATSRTGTKGHARNKSYSEIAAERARKAAHTKPPPQPARTVAGRTQGPPGIVTKYRDITEIPDGFRPIRFDDSDHDEDSLANEEDNLRRSGFHQQQHDSHMDHAHRYGDDNAYGKYGEGDDYDEDRSEYENEGRYEQRNPDLAHKQRSSHQTAYAHRSTHHDDSDNEPEDEDIDAQIARLQSQIAQYDSRESVSQARTQVGDSRAGAAAEPKPMSKQELLVYSKKARPVEFRPYTLTDYKKNHNHAGYYEVGNLQPDLNTEELRAKRENLQRVKEFSKQLREYNARAAAIKPLAQEPSDHPKEPSTRDKALEFARSIPKPKLKPAAPVTKKSQGRYGRVSYGGEERAEEETVGLTRSKLDELEVEHERARKQVEAIKRSLGF